MRKDVFPVTWFRRFKTLLFYPFFKVVIPLVIVFSLLPQFVPIIYTFQLNAVLIAVLFAVSLNLLIGYGGMISFGHAAYYSLAAYTTALLFKNHSVSFPLAIAAGPIVALLGAVIFGFFAVRAGGTYFLMLTLAFAQLTFAVIYQSYDLTNGDDGISGLLLQGLLGNPINYYYFSLIIVVICLMLIYGVLHSPFGYTLQAIRDNPTRVEALGVPIKRYKLLAFAIAGFFGGVAGSLFVFFNGQVSPQVAFWTQSAEPFMAVIIGGSTSFFGPVVGAALYTFMGTQLARLTQYSLLIVGIVVLAIGLFFPKGIVGSIAELRIFRRGENRSDDNNTTGIGIKKGQQSVWRGLGR